MTNAEVILDELDRRLDTRVDLTLYGRAAFLLGFEDPPDVVSQSLDVDAVLWLGQAEELAASSNFWRAVDAVNGVLAPRGLYMSHLFVEDQVILTAEWRRERVPIDGRWRHLDLGRLSDADLLLSKLMRDDPQDRQDALFIVNRNHWGPDTLRELFRRARVPPIEEIAEEFAEASRKLLEAAGAAR